MKSPISLIASFLILSQTIAYAAEEYTVCDEFASVSTTTPVASLCPVMCDATANHATFDTSTNKLNLSKIDIPALDPITSQPNGSIVVTDIQLNLLSGANDFSVDTSSFVVQSIATQYHDCHPHYTYQNGVGYLFIPFVEVPSLVNFLGISMVGPTQVFAAKLIQLPASPTVFSLKNYQLLYTY